MIKLWMLHRWTAATASILLVALAGCASSGETRGVARQDGRVPTADLGSAEKDFRRSGTASSRNIYFGFDMVDLAPEHVPIIESVATSATQARRVLFVVGSCESPCSPQQLEASARRARAVATALERLGVPEQCIKREPARVNAPGATDEDARAEARRVTIAWGDDNGACWNRSSRREQSNSRPKPVVA
jgi:outer membrane protein OmpA-like peptidoglycan-associated protein